MRIWGRLRLFQAGLIAGCIQTAIVLVITPLMILFAQYRDDDSNASGRDPASSVISLLPLIYVVFAAGVALTKHRYLTLTTTRIRHASRLMSSSEPERAAGTIAICLLFASIGCASFALQPPPARRRGKDKSGSIRSYRVDKLPAPRYIAAQAAVGFS